MLEKVDKSTKIGNKDLISSFKFEHLKVMKKVRGM